MDTKVVQTQTESCFIGIMQTQRELDLREIHLD
jgi:hypothetical protein